MAGLRFKTVDDYLAAQPPVARRALKTMRSIIRKTMPGAQEVISYGIPAFRLHGRIALYLAGWTAHYSIYPSSRAMERAFKKELAAYETSGRGTIRFPLSAPVPVRLVTALVKFRIKEAESRNR
jgi:uncharacterized protein YdhG (YjbR/CyaY superfamily)